MHVLLTGGTGFIGTALSESLLAQGHTLTILSRGEHTDRPGLRFVRDLEQVSASTVVDGIVNLAGASLAGERWNAGYKREIVASRLETTAAVIALCERLQQPPAVLVSGSAIGYYGPRGDEAVDEDADAGEGFAAELCQRWEQEALRAEGVGVRVCLARLGVVFDRGEGAFEELVRPFRFGIANWLGSGRQWLSWVHRADVVSALRWLLEHEELDGPMNITAPGAVTSRDLCTALQKRMTTLPAMPVPAPVMRLLVGEMADELLLAGQRVRPARLGTAGFAFSYPRIEDALDAILKRD